MLETSAFQSLHNFFSKSVCQRATAPLRKGVEIAVAVDGQGPFTLHKGKSEMQILERAPEKPDMRFDLPLSTLQNLEKNPTEDIGEIGIAILQALADSDPTRRMNAKIYIGPLDLMLKGYLGVLPLGGASVMKFLASKGFNGISKIKEGISRFRG